MGKRINTSTTAVINTELIPLTDSFELVPNGQTEQWYYENTNIFAPDRQVTPLIITPKIVAVDRDTNTTYNPSIHTISWYALEYSGSAWSDTLITNTTDSLSNDYVIVGNTLKINKNIDDATHGVQIKCKVQYIDPRDSGITYAVESTLLLTTNKDATVIYPTIDIQTESALAFNPLEMVNATDSRFTFVASYTYDVDTQHDPSPTFIFEWYGVKNNAEVKIDTLPWYVSGQNTNTLVVDAMYCEEMQIILRIKDSAAPTVLLPPKAHRSVVWKIPRIDGITTSENGSAVRSDSKSFDFTTIVNISGKTLDEDTINENLRFKWKLRKSDQSTVTEKGWGRKMNIDASELINVRGSNNSMASTVVGNEIYLLGAKEQVTQGGEAVTYGGAAVYNREI